ncbi:MAG: methionyl-tRNA formyltransferase [Planctomycetota bacterium]
MRVTLLASSEFALPALDGLIGGGHELAVGSQPSRPAGRGLRMIATPVAQRAAELGLAPREVQDINALADLAWLTATQPDLVVVVAFGQKLGPAVRAVAPWGCVNLHPSLLPRWRGAAPVPAAVLAGDEHTGVCVIDVAQRMDAGDILAVRRTPVGRKTAGELLQELARTGAELLLEAIDGLARGDIVRRVQDEAQVTRAPKLSPDSGRIRWEHSAPEVDRRVRAVTPQPGAFSLLPNGMRLSILAGEPAECPRGHLPGEVLSGPAQELVVACGSGAYRLLRLQREGRRPLDAGEFLRGQPLPPGTRLGP